MKPSWEGRRFFFLKITKYYQEKTEQPITWNLWTSPASLPQCNTKKGIFVRINLNTVKFPFADQKITIQSHCLWIRNVNGHKDETIVRELKGSFMLLFAFPLWWTTAEMVQTYRQLHVGIHLGERVYFKLSVRLSCRCLWQMVQTKQHSLLYSWKCFTEVQRSLLESNCKIIRRQHFSD